MLLIDGVKYKPWTPKDEEKEFHPMIKRQAKKMKIKYCICRKPKSKIFLNQIKIRMSEIPTWTPDLILRLIGALTGLFGAIAGLFAVLKFLREKPNLKIEVLECNYWFRQPEKQTRLHIYFNVDNIGDRGTQLKSLEVSFEYKGKLYKDKQLLEMEIIEDTFVDAHKSKEMRWDFYFRDLSIEYAPTLDCTFTLHHTHDKVEFCTKAPYPKP